MLTRILKAVAIAWEKGKQRGETANKQKMSDGLGSGEKAAESIEIKMGWKTCHWKTTRSKIAYLKSAIFCCTTIWSDVANNKTKFPGKEFKKYDNLNKQWRN